MTANDEFWLDAERPFQVLLSQPGELLPSSGSIQRRLNALSRLIILAGIVVPSIVLVRGGDMAQQQALLAVAIALGALALVVYYYRKQIPPAEKEQSQSLAAVMANEPYKTGLVDPINNPVGNPTPYEPGTAVRSAKPPMELIEEEGVGQFYRGSGEMPGGLFIYRIPDPTLMARSVFWPEAPQPDIVSKEAACGDRNCR